MVGVPRSNACSTCRKRRKGCDLRRPICGQCQRLGIECGGYGRERLFLNATVDNVTPRKRPETCEGEIVVHDTLVRSSYEDKVLGMYWDAYLPGSRVISGQTVQLLEGWSNTLRELYVKDGVLRKALLAMGLRTLGRRNGDQWMSDEGLKLYISAMQDMSAALSVPSKARRADALLTASKIFSHYEAQYGADDRDRLSQANSWLAHCHGEIALITSRPPEQYSSSHAHRLFVDGRRNLIASALMARKASFLSEEKWRTLPWRNRPKSLKDRLIDILVDMPTLREDLDIMNCCDDPSQREILREKLIDDCWYHDKRLAEWYETKPPASEDSFRVRGADESLKPEDLAEAHIMTLYWSTCVILYQEVPKIIRSDVVLPERANARTYCRMIIEKLPIFLHPSVGTFRTHILTFPLHVAFKYIRDFVPKDEMIEERALVASYLEGPETTSIGRFIGSLGSKLADIR